MKFTINILLVIATMLVFACNNPKTEKETKAIDNAGQTTSNDIVELSQAQLKIAEIALGSLRTDTISSVVEANGHIELLPNNLATINPPINGFVVNISYIEGATVKKGEPLFELKHSDIIELQKNYIQAYNQFTVAQQEVDRQKILSDANVSAQKQYQQASADFKTAKAQRNAIARQLFLIGINPEDVENGRIFNSISVNAPFWIIVSKVYSHKGQLVTTGETVIEIVNTDKLLLKLNVFEQDINKIKVGQNLTFIMPSFGNNKIYKSTVSFMGKTLDKETRTIQITSILSTYSELIPGLYAEAKIYCNPRISEVLPDESLIREDNREFVFLLQSNSSDTSLPDELIFKKLEVETGISEIGVTEILNAEKLPINTKFVIKGAYYLKSEMNKGGGMMIRLMKTSLFDGINISTYREVKQNTNIKHKT